MPDISRITEIAVYSLLNFLPFLFFGVIPFSPQSALLKKDHRRFNSLCCNAPYFRAE